MKTTIQILFLALCFSAGTTLRAQWAKVNGPADFIATLATFDTTIFAGTYGGGAFRSTNNGQNWTSISSGLTPGNSTSVSVCAFASNGVNLFAGTYNGVFRSTNGGTDWTATDSSLSGISVRALALVDGVIFAGTDFHGLLRSTNNGASWTSAIAEAPSASIAALATVGTTFFAGGYGIFLSKDKGMHWTSVNSEFSGGGVYAFTGFAGNVFAGSGWGVLVSSDTGKSWTQKNAGIIGGARVEAFASDGGHLFTATDGKGVYALSVDGTEWENMSHALTDQYVQALTIRGGTLLLGTWGGGVWRRPLVEMYPSVVFASREFVDFGRVLLGTSKTDSVVIYNKDKVTLSIDSIGTDSAEFKVSAPVGLTPPFLIAPNGSQIFYVAFSPASQGQVVGQLSVFHNAVKSPFRLTIFGNGYVNSIGDKNGQGSPTFSLSQNYPNPFNPSTIIQYSIPRQTRVTLTIFDILGRQVAQLEEGVKQVGRYEVQWNANGFPSGIYFYRLNAGSFTETKKLLLLK